MAFRLPRGAQLIRFPSADGLQLEGRLTPGDRTRSVVLCHPHPLYGGSMLTPVILTVEAAFHAVGFTTLAFNFRGVGASEGVHGEGRTEVADVAGALAHLRASLDGSPGLLAVAGYSFGATSAAAPPRPIPASASTSAWPPWWPATTMRSWRASAGASRSSVAPATSTPTPRSSTR